MVGLCEGGSEPPGSLKAICNAFVRSPNKSIRSAARELILLHTTVHKVLHKNLRLFAYKIQLVQAFQPDDYPRRTAAMSDRD
ncbi:hypothetical protein ANN_19548 [Periplaneta americana]|uniref:Uncharacterized protein n=1 Tax=Periplaneta americana TaxID=6978 RepID=A0ABQ8SAU3_PERAM|nr:hypothetical protein ANN_19548 [Periplaneta americana]